MPRFLYTAVDARGVENTGQLSGPDVQAVSVILRARGLFPTDVVSADQGRIAATSPDAGRTLAAKRRTTFRSMQRVTGRERAAFTRQLATMVKAGMPLVRALDVLGRQERNARFRQVLVELADSIRSGSTLSDAMARHPAVFDRLGINMVRAGETGGALETVLERVAHFQEKSRQLRGKVIAAMVYPSIVLLVAGAILAGLLVFVVPKFKQIFADLLKGAPLPPLTQCVLALSEAVKSHVLIATGFAVGLGLLIRGLRRTAAGERLIDSLLLSAPVFGSLVLKAVVARFARTLGTLLASGVPILPALLITRDTCGNRRVAGAIEQVHEHVKAGASFAQPLDQTGVFPPVVASMIDVGEHTGQLPAMLAKVADIYEEEVDQAVAGLSSLIEPILILFLAVVVGTIVIALFLPIVRIVQLLT